MESDQLNILMAHKKDKTFKHDISINSRSEVGKRIITTKLQIRSPGNHTFLPIGLVIMFNKD